MCAHLFMCKCVCARVCTVYMCLTCVYVCVCVCVCMRVIHVCYASMAMCMHPSCVSTKYRQ